MFFFQESAEASENKVTEMTSAVSELQKLLKQASEGKKNNCINLSDFYTCM